MRHFKSTFYLYVVIALGGYMYPATVSAQTDSTKEVLQAVRNGDVHHLTSLIINGMDINQGNAYGFTPLMEAARIGNKEMIDFLLSHNSDVNAQNDAGGTALMIAAKYGHTYTVDALLKHGADPTIINNYGNKALKFASAYKQQTAYEILLLAEQNFGSTYRTDRLSAGS